MYKECVVIGNGRSMDSTPIKYFSRYDTFACGRINLLYYRSHWRPTYYVLAEKLRKIDEPRLRRDFDKIFTNTETMGFIQEGMRPLVNSRYRDKRVEFFTTCLHALDKEPPTEWHLPELCSYGSSVHVALQIANILEYDYIYLVGCDITGGHFHIKEYGDSVTEPELWTHAHQIAKRSSKAKIYNATKGGTLEVYERINLDARR